MQKKRGERFSDENRLMDMLYSEKWLAELCSRVALSSMDVQMKNDFMTVLDDEQQIVYEIMTELQKRRPLEAAGP